MDVCFSMLLGRGGGGGWVAADKCIWSCHDSCMLLSGGSAVTAHHWDFQLTVLLLAKVGPVVQGYDMVAQVVVSFFAIMSELTHHFQE